MMGIRCGAANGWNPTLQVKAAKAWNTRAPSERYHVLTPVNDTKSLVKAKSLECSMCWYATSKPLQKILLMFEIVGANRRLPKPIATLLALAGAMISSVLIGAGVGVLVVVISLAGLGATAPQPWLSRQSPRDYLPVWLCSPSWYRCTTPRPATRSRYPQYCGWQRPSATRGRHARALTSRWTTGFGY